MGKRAHDAEPPQPEVVDDEHAGVPARLADALPRRLPVLASPPGPLFPGMMSPVPVDDPRSEASLRQAERFVAVVAVRPEWGGDGVPAPRDLYDAGCVGQLVHPTTLPGERRAVIVGGIKRLRVVQLIEADGVLVADLEYPDEQTRDPREVAALQQRLRAGFKELVGLSPELPDQVGELVDGMGDPGALADLVGANLGRDVAERQGILEAFELGERLRRALLMVERQLDLAQLGAKLRDEIREGIEAKQKEHYLREQLRAIRRELGEEVDQRQLDRDTYQERIARAGMPEEAERRARQELDRLTLLPSEASEYHVIRTYLDWLVDLPWSREEEERIDLARARRILDQDHHGLEEVKERIVEFLAVRRLRPDQQGAILCLVGPPGVGKTSLGRSVARATGRPFHRVSLGGMRDEAEIKGHRRTYVGAMPGKVIQGLRRVGARNPVFMLDELDKLSSDWRGDPASALLEVLDPAQNSTFEDHYLDLPFDLSHVLFVATANVAAEIPAPLLDRTELLRLPGYIPTEKRAIARRYLLPRQLEANGLRPSHLAVSRDALAAVVQRYTREAGVRELERMIGRVCRKVAARVAVLPDPEQAPRVEVTAANLAEFLGPPRYTVELLRRCRRPGVVVGLAWTPVGGEILFIEATSMPGKGGFKLTGKLGDVMSESAHIAHSLVRSRADAFGIPPEVFSERDLHLHVPAGAIPKDGPSAGVAMVCALASLLSGSKGRPARARTAMTGEVTLRGAVLPVGGIREKVVAAKLAGVKTVIAPAGNEPDVQQLPKDVARGLRFVFVEEVEEAVAKALR